jgi:hypothetical protein
VKCYNGIFVKSQGHYVPCSKCTACKINKGRNWTARILMERAATKQYTWFVTLTYEDKHVDRSYQDGTVLTLRKRRASRFFKEARSEIPGIRYLAVGEYGERFGRPHLHAAVFPRQEGDVQRLESLWRPRGFTQAVPLEDGHAKYLAKYTVKKLTQAEDKRLLPGQEPEFMLGSRRPAIGAAYVAYIVRYYRTKEGQRVLAEKGDVARTIRFGRAVYAIPPYVLQQIRSELDIPVLHRDRMANEKYAENYTTEEAEYCPDQYAAQEYRLNAAIRQKKLRNAATSL